MRFLFTFLTTGLILSIHLLDRPDWIVWTEKQLGSQIDENLYIKELRFDGLHQLSRVDVERYLPQERSVAWWMANQESIKGSLAQNPYIAQTQISKCSDAEWGCFLVSIEERKPRFVVAFQSAKWSVSADGTFLRKIQPHEALPAETIFVHGSKTFDECPDRLKSTLQASEKNLDLIEKRVKTRVASVNFLNSGDFEVGLQNTHLTARFTSEENDSSHDLEKQALRLAGILKELGPNSEKVSHIDLSYPRFAVLSP